MILYALLDPSTGEVIKVYTRLKLEQKMANNPEEVDGKLFRRFEDKDDVVIANVQGALTLMKPVEE